MLNVEKELIQTWIIIAIWQNRKHTNGEETYSGGSNTERVRNLDGP